MGELRHVPLSRRVRPHLPVHRRNQQRAFARKARREQIIGAPLRSFAEIGGCGCDKDGIRPRDMSM
jgi:hypothetical protein